MTSLNLANANQQNSSPCSALVNVIINFPGISQAINAASISTSATEEPNTIQVTIQGSNSNQQENVLSQEAASTEVIHQHRGATAHVHMPHNYPLGPGEQEVSQTISLFFEILTD